MSSQAQSDSVTLRMPREILADIDLIAKGTDRSRSYIILRALRTYLLNEGADILESIRGREQIASGEYENFDDVIAELDRIIAMDAA